MMTLQIGEHTQQRSQNYSLTAENGLTLTVSKLHEMPATHTAGDAVLRPSADNQTVDRLSPAHNVSLRTRRFCNPSTTEAAFAIPREPLLGLRVFARRDSAGCLTNFVAGSVIGADRRRTHVSINRKKEQSH